MNLDWKQVIEDCYDPVNHALRVKTGEAEGTPNARDAGQLIEAMHIPTFHALRVEGPTQGSGTYGTRLDWRQVIKAAVDGTKGEITIVGD